MARPAPDPGEPAVGSCVHELVAAQAAERPDATAVAHRDRRLSYAELDARADRLAALLSGAGVRGDTVVGVQLQRGPAMVVALLAVLKAGGGYAMLDPEFPANRLRGMLADVDSQVVISRPGMRLPGLGSGISLVLVDDVADHAGYTERAAPAERVTVVPAVHTERPGPGAGPRVVESGGRTRCDQVACVMFTSGSTGRPKGIVSPHRAVTGTLTGQRFASFGPGAVWLQCSPVSWDAFALELWGPLMNGGTCVLQPGQRPDPVEIRRQVAAYGVTSMYLSGSLFNLIVDEYPAALAGVDEVIVGGEALSPVHLSRARRAWPDLRLSNGYGPVEGMVFLTVHPVSSSDLAGGPVPIGRPLSGKRVYLLDERLRPVADGATGELYAAGPGLARGYADRPALTAERFVADPYGPQGERMYRTGDLARRRADGVLEFIGRADAQVKIRGFRVEPGEIEAVLAQHPGLDRAAVVADRDAAGDGRLVAYVVPRGGRQRAPTYPQLRAHAATQLPDFMVPAAMVVVDALPLTTTGKLDCAALPPPPATVEGAGGPAREPRTELEKRLCALFAEVLGVASVGVDDNFFDLGGHSLLAARLLGRMHAVLGVQVDVPTIFGSPTVAGLAPLVTAAREGAVTAPVPAPRGGRSPLSFAQGRLWFLDRIAGPDGGVAYNLPTLVWMRGTVDADILRAALGDVVARHDALRTVFDDHGGEPVPRVLSGSAATPGFQQVRVNAADLAARVTEAARHRFDLAAELPVHAVLFTVADRPGEHALLVVMHHIAADGWSLPPFFHDLSCAHAARLAGQDGAAPPLPPTTVGYAEYARREQDRLGDPDDPHSRAARQLRYWRRALQGLPPGQVLPRRTGVAAMPGARAAATVRRLDPEVHAQLVEVARGCGATLFMVLHTALTAVLSRSGAGNEVAIAAPVAGRGTDGAVDDVVGFFVNLLVLRADTSGDPTAEELLTRIRDTDLAAFAHQEVPFEWVVADLNPPRSPGRHPFTDVVLALQNNARARLDLPGVATRIELLRTGRAMFDLLVDVADEYGTGGVPEGIVLTVEYATDLFDDQLAEWLAEALVRTLHTIAARPGLPLSQVAVPDPPCQLDEPVPASSHPAPEQAPPAAPGSGLERRIAAVWSQVLGLETVGAHDNFFSLGGTSLRAVRVAARLTTAEKRLVTAEQIFAAPTVAGLARVLSATPAAGEDPDPIPRLPRTAGKEAPWT